MEKLDLKDIQNISLDILISFDSFCRKNGLKYSLGAGTMIGAVRHKGFIPWDDDIDIFMRRHEYDRFVELVKETKFIKKDKYKVLLPFEDGSYYPFIKIVDVETVVYERYIKKMKNNGVWIDIFPIDYCADSEQESKKIVKVQKKMARKYCRVIAARKNNSLENICKNVFCFFSRVRNHNLKKRYQKQIETYAVTSKCKYSGTIVWPSSENDIYPDEFFDEYIESEFENHTFMMFKRYDDILSHRYGDYMQLPDEKDRVSHLPEAYKLS